MSNRAALMTDILRRGLVPYSDADSNKRETEFFLGAVEKATVFVADNVASWFRHQREGQVDLSRDLPCIVPPYSYTWIEWADYWENSIDRVGVLYMSQDFGSDDDGGTASVQSRMRSIFGNKTNIIGDCSHIVPTEPVRWLLYALPVGRLSGGQPLGPIKTWVGALTPEGAIAKGTAGHLCNGSLYPAGFDDIEGAKAFTQLMTEGFLALSFLNCRNVVSVERLPSRQERRSAERRGEPVVTFRTINIEPMKTVLRTEGGIEQNGLRRALHICRGHFVHYSEDKPLFGKYAGTFWKPAHVRGDLDAGVVSKDYSVKAPKNVA